MSSFLHQNKEQSPTRMDYSDVCDSFIRLIIEDSKTVASSFQMEQNDSGLGDEIAELEVSCPESEMHDSITTNGSNPIHTMDRIKGFFSRDEDGDTLLHISIVQKEESIAFHIIDMAPDFTCLNFANNVGQTALHLAVLTNQSHTIGRLLSAGASIDIQDQSGNTPLHQACAHGHTAVVKQFVELMTYEATPRGGNRFPYQCAVPQVMKLMNFEGFNCLHLAVVNNHFDVVQILMEAGINIYLGHGKSGRTAIHLAADSGNIGMLNLLAKTPNVNLDVPDFDGLTPFQLALGREFHEVMAVLIQNGATYKTIDFDFDTEDTDSEMCVTPLSR